MEVCPYKSTSWLIILTSTRLPLGFKILFRRQKTAQNLQLLFVATFPLLFSVHVYLPHHFTQSSPSAFSWAVYLWHVLA